MPILKSLNRVVFAIGIGPLRPGRLPLARRLYQPLYEWLTPRAPFRIPLEVEGFKIYASALDTGVSWFLLRQGHIEGLTTTLFRQELKRGMVVIDLGASIGYFTMLAAKIVGNEGKVFAFEPNKSHLELLLKSVRANGFENVVGVPKAVFNRTGKIKLTLTPDTRQRAVDAVRLDDFFAGLDGRIDFIKMDIDGAEPFALEGMRKILETNPGLKMVAEYDPACIRRYGKSPAAYLEQFADLGLEIRAVYDEIRKYVGPPDLSAILSVKDVVNLFLVRSATS